MLAWLSSAVLGGLIVYFVWITTTDYLANHRNQPGTVWQNILAACKDSATMVWARFVIVITAFIQFVANSADQLGSPEFSQTIKDYLDPNYVGFILIGVMLVTIYARNRTLG